MHETKKLDCDISQLKTTTTARFAWACVEDKTASLIHSHVQNIPI